MKQKCKGIKIKELNAFIRKNMKFESKPDDKFIQEQWDEILKTGEKIRKEK